jgi:hypothetical protein
VTHRIAFRLAVLFDRLNSLLATTRRFIEQNEDAVKLKALH